MANLKKVKVGDRVVITEVHKSDAFYEDRDTIIGKSGTINEEGPHLHSERGYLALGIHFDTPRLPCMTERSYFFHAIKVKAEESCPTEKSG